MNNEIYRRTVKSAQESDFGESELIVATEENNGYAVFHVTENETKLLKWFGMGLRDSAIEFAVEEASKRRMD